MRFSTFTFLRIFPLVLLLSACSGGLFTNLGVDYEKPTLPIENQWHFKPTRVAHQGDTRQLARWWDNFHDATLSQLLKAAQQQSASLAKAKAAIEQARAALVSDTAAGLPSVDASLGYNHSLFNFGGSMSITRDIHQLNHQASWEIDLFGGLARQREADNSQLAARAFAWHDARVSVAAELANAYLDYRYCELKKHLAAQTAQSRKTAEQLAAQIQQAGFQSASELALNQASTAESANALSQQTARCERAVKGLVAMTGLKEADLRQLLASRDDLPTPPPLPIAALPAQVILQRPDVAAAEREVAMASANIGVAEANRFPKLTLTGNIAPAFQSINAGALLFTPTWAIGPTLSLPLFDGGKRLANLQAAKAQYEAAVAQFHSVVRTAVKEVEDAQVRLLSVAQQLPQTRAMVDNYQKILSNTEQLQAAGLANLIDVEIARRNLLTAQLLVHDNEYEQVLGYVALYRAVGGGFE